MKERWLPVWTSFVCAAVGIALFQRGPAQPIVATSRTDPALFSLESAVSLDPTNAHATQELADALLADGAPGLALAAIDRAPKQVRRIPRVADAKARALVALGEATRALQVERQVLAQCETAPCSRGLAAHARWREQWLSHLVELRVEDVQAEPNRALLAYRLSTREVRLDSSGAW